MAGIGAEGAYGLAGLQASIRQRMMDQLEAEKRGKADRQQQFENEMRLREQADRRTFQTAQLAGLEEQRLANADLRRQNAAHVLTQDLTPGDVLEPAQGNVLRAGNMGSAIEHQAATLPSTQFGGGVTMPALRGRLVAPSGDVGPEMGDASSGVTSMRTNAGNPARQVYRGTLKQRRESDQEKAQRDFIASLPPGSRERRVAEYEHATGRNAPSIFMPQPQREPTPRYQFLPTYDDQGNATGLLSGNTVTGQVSPVSVPGGGQLRQPKVMDNPKNPRGVQNYLLQLRTKYSGDLEAAEQELGRAWPDIVAAHPNVEATTVVNALRSMFGTAPGAGNGIFGGLGPILGTGEPPSGATPSRSSSGTTPRIGEQRLINGQVGEWDGRGWVPVQ